MGHLDLLICVKDYLVFYDAGKILLMNIYLKNILKGECSANSSAYFFSYYVGNSMPINIIFKLHAHSKFILHILFLCEELLYIQN